VTMSDPHPTPTAAIDNSAVHHEASDINLRGVLGFGLGLMIAAVFIYFFVWLLFLYFAGRETVRGVPQFPLAIGQQDRLPPEPRLQTNPRQDMRELRATEDATLDSYGWIDKSAGIVRIPIAEAMKLTVQKGLPARGGRK
jgi:hypothetical protein